MARGVARRRLTLTEKRVPASSARCHLSHCWSSLLACVCAAWGPTMLKVAPHTRWRCENPTPASGTRHGDRERARSASTIPPWHSRRLGILISGTGSNMKSIVAACEAGEVPAEVAIVISNRADAPGIEWAAGARARDGRSVPPRFRRPRSARPGGGRSPAARPGWSGSVSPATCDCCRRSSSMRTRIESSTSIPALLPSFPGLHGQRQAWKYGVKVSGCTVHLVDLELDHGPIVIQRSVPVLG